MNLTLIETIQTLLFQIEGDQKFARLYEELSNVNDELVLEWPENLRFEPFENQDAFKS
jgi:hypothetical protein